MPGTTKKSFKISKGNSQVTNARILHILHYSVGILLCFKINSKHSAITKTLVH